MTTTYVTLLYLTIGYSNCITDGNFSSITKLLLHSLNKSYVKKLINFVTIISITGNFVISVKLPDNSTLPIARKVCSDVVE